MNPSQYYPKFDAFCINCGERLTYMVMTLDYFEFRKWLEKTDRLAARCIKCQTDSCILFGEVFGSQK